MDLLDDFLKQTRLTPQDILGILRDEEVEPLEAIEKLIAAASKAFDLASRSQRYDEQDDAYDRISLYNMEQRLAVFKEAFAEEMTSVAGLPMAP